MTIGTPINIPIGAPMVGVIDLITGRLVELEQYVLRLEAEIEVLKGPKINLTSETRTLEVL